MPALSSAQESGRRTTCLSHQRQTVLALNLMINDFKGSFRLGAYRWFGGNEGNVFYQSFNPGTGVTGRPVGIGILPRLNYLGGIDGFYCPTNTYVNDYRDHGPILGRARYNRTGPTAVEVFGDYVFNTMLMELPVGSLRPPTDPSDDDFKLDDNHPAFPVITDVFMQNDPGLPSMRSFYRPHRDDGISVTYIDGSGQYLRLRSIGNVGPGFYDYGNLSANPTNWASWSGWARIYRMRGGR